MPRPSEVNTGDLFWGSSLQNFQKETVARNLTMLIQTIAEAKHDDSWQPFTMAEYVGFRGATSEEPVNCFETVVLNNLVNGGYLVLGEGVNSSYSVTEAFLGVVAEFAVQKVDTSAAE